ncbi:hypothetical protein ACHAWU_010379 [Discostella pseudostelligera]|uniref:Cyclin N-terminal domain-containing protein n=1 Tax=Discostella pseudostelligera TaxID=259834 RepID=A0ABD3MQK8_9STRA
MNTRARSSMRLRSQGANTDNDAATTTAATSGASRTALGNISNRDDSKGQKEKKPTKRKSSAIEEQPQKGKGRAAKSTDSKSVTKVPAKRRVSPRLESLAAGTVKCAENETSTTNKTSSKSTKGAPSKAPSSKKGGIKRSSTDGPIANQPSGRTSKRTKKSSEAEAVAEPVAVRRSTRSRSQSSSVSASSRRKNATKKSTGRRVEEVAIIPAGDNRVVPQDFGLQRSSFKCDNFTYGIAYYDESERSDPLLCKDYVTDMFQQLYHAETISRPQPYMDRQDDINEKMRAILIDWLIEVHMKFRLVPETLYLCVNIIDRYCSVVNVPRTKLQLVGVTSLFLACKHEEIYPPEVRDCVYITDRAYDRQEVLDMEQTILRVLKWKISLPTAFPFLDRFLSLTKASPMTKVVAAYYLERTLQEHDMLQYRPSMVCASAVILALNNPDIRVAEEDWFRECPGLPKILMEYTQFDEKELWKCIALVAQKVSGPSICASKRHLNAVKKKYENKKYLSVSTDLVDPDVRFVQYKGSRCPPPKKRRDS